MEKTFVRVYHLKDGKTYVAGAFYPSEELAEKDLHIYNPVESGSGFVPDFSNLAYATIETRYTPLPAIDSNWIVDQAI